MSSIDENHGGIIDKIKDMFKEMNKWVVSVEGINEVVNKCESLLIEMDNWFTEEIMIKTENHVQNTMKLWRYLKLSVILSARLFDDHITFKI